jgi:protein-disulfide isomerase
MQQYIDSGKIRYAILDMPLEMHKAAFKAAEASHCAKEQGKFWEMHQSMLFDQKTLDALNPHAESIGLDMARFDSCLKTNKYADAVRKDMTLASALGVSGTPSFILALTDSRDPSKVKGISLIRGARPFESFKQAIDQALADIKK